ncbi:uncharacterized protein BP01DRAFT_151867 [Aspergillus saccharolyticus JOP 1030-1]|uniref:Uncharacterized protein n=1 Tax=Aspergillus saccharolyticus JOP 1030-1 TaxID=1450539 RepID=A0A318ZM28_9EURO|nr:hypothetical protein BP01DRAFT_151867 [Aspergillus saccharolyticus JOP 1030-1]PYH48596.1 hypothetical protein BP01DRAFT_151867 [Aspergillus saccharolyticus JOP 1030-1]
MFQGGRQALQSDEVPCVKSTYASFVWGPSGLSRDQTLPRLAVPKYRGILPSPIKAGSVSSFSRPRVAEQLISISLEEIAGRHTAVYPVKRPTCWTFFFLLSVLYLTDLSSSSPSRHSPSPSLQGREAVSSLQPGLHRISPYCLPWNSAEIG